VELAQVLKRKPDLLAPLADNDRLGVVGGGDAASVSARDPGPVRPA